MWLFWMYHESTITKVVVIWTDGQNISTTHFPMRFIVPGETGMGSSPGEIKRCILLDFASEKNVTLSWTAVHEPPYSWILGWVRCIRGPRNNAVHRSTLRTPSGSSNRQEQYLHISVSIQAQCDLPRRVDLQCDRLCLLYQERGRQ